MPTGVYPRHPPSKETRLAISRSMTGPKHHRWLANPPYDVLHRWVRDHKTRTGVCEHCGTSPPRKIDKLGREYAGTHFANVSGDYRRDVDDYIELCLPCHRSFDAKGGDS